MTNNGNSCKRSASPVCDCSHCANPQKKIKRCDCRSCTAHKQTAFSCNMDRELQRKQCQLIDQWQKIVTNQNDCTCNDCLDIETQEEPCEKVASPKTSPRKDAMKQPACCNIQTQNVNCKCANCKKQHCKDNNQRPSGESAESECSKKHVICCPQHCCTGEDRMVLCINCNKEIVCTCNL